MQSLSELRAHLLTHSLFPKTDLKRAISRLGFVQADPIRSPARSQDLILRHRVKNYKAGDLEKHYPSLGLEEDYTFAYGFLPTKNRDLLHPKSNYNPSTFENKVIAAVKKIGPAHPNQLEEHCGSEKVRNAWGGNSKATKQALENAHHHGHLRVARRDKGIRVYEAISKIDQHLSPEERFAKLTLLTSNLFGPTCTRFLLSEVRYKHLLATPAQRAKALRNLVETKQLESRCIDSIEYIFSKTKETKHTANDSVKILAPFDPIVRDRDRFEHLWGWTYRFEAYTPAAKRVRGYYALPILWQDDIIGWANAKVVGSNLNVEIGYERKPKNPRAFKSALKQELSDLAIFLHLDPDAWSMTEL